MWQCKVLVVAPVSWNTERKKRRAVSRMPADCLPNFTDVNIFFVKEIVMLKKIAYAVVTSGLFLAPLGASAMVTNPTFPVCVGSDCASALADEAHKASIAAPSHSKREASGRETRVAEQKRTSDSAFPVDTSKD